MNVSKNIILGVAAQAARQDSQLTGWSISLDGTIEEVSESVDAHIHTIVVTLVADRPAADYHPVFNALTPGEVRRVDVYISNQGCRVICWEPKQQSFEQVGL
jgi:hypothetical protein